MQLTDHFTRKEFDCKCGCGTPAKMDSEFMRMLEEARTIAGVPFVINSGYRCPLHKQKSMNHFGNAADIACTNDRLRWIILHALIMAGFRRIGLNPAFIHADNMDRATAAKAAWFY